MVLSHKGLSQPDMEGEQGRGRSGAGLAFQSCPKLRLGLWALIFPCPACHQIPAFLEAGMILGKVSLLRVAPGEGLSSALSAPNALFLWGIETAVLRGVWAAAHHSDLDPVLSRW